MACESKSISVCAGAGATLPFLDALKLEFAMAKLHSIRKLINITPGLVAINKFVINKYPEMKTKSKGNTHEAMGARRCRPPRKKQEERKKKGGVKRRYN
jgi:hypothetical protein